MTGKTFIDILSEPAGDPYVVIPPWLYHAFKRCAERDGVAFDEWCDKNLGHRFGKPQIFESTPIMETEP